MLCLKYSNQPRRVAFTALMIVGCAAEKRLRDCDAELVAVADGYRSSAQGSKMVFQMRMMVAEDYLDRVRANFPKLPIVSRARNVSHYFELKLRGVEIVERETFEAALKVGRASLEVLGTDRYRAKELADAFRRHNIAGVDATLPFYQDEARRMSLAKQGREELEKQFARDRERFEREHVGAMPATAKSETRTTRS